MRRSWLAAALAALASLPGTADAQRVAPPLSTLGSLSAPAPAVPAAVELRAPAAPALAQEAPGTTAEPSGLRELSRYVGWGMAIGGAAGLGYALLFEKGSEAGFRGILDVGIGATAGMVVGALVYFVKNE